MIERVGLKLILIERSSVRATAIATPRIPSIPRPEEITSMFGRARSINDARRPPIKMNGRRLPFQNQTLSLITPTITCPKIPAIGPAAQTSPTSWISSLYFVLSIQLNAEI